MGGGPSSDGPVARWPESPDRADGRGTVGVHPVNGRRRDTVARGTPERGHWSVRGRVRHVGLLVATGLLGLLIAAELASLAGNARIFPEMVGHDHRLYMDATLQWLAGGPFYPEWQLTGTYTDNAWPILYPPQALFLFVPFTVLPAFLWYAIPILITAWVVVGFRPQTWTWPVMLGLFALWPMQWLSYVYGTPTMWLVAALAAGLRWGWPGALILVKPSLLPLALVGITRRGWWFTVAALFVGGVLFAGMTVDWVRSVMNLSGPRSGVLYSLENLPMMLVPIVAWLGRTPGTPAWSPGWRRDRPPTVAIDDHAGLGRALARALPRRWWHRTPSGLRRGGTRPGEAAPPITTAVTGDVPVGPPGSGRR
jgi:hypothetical protein